MPRFIKIISLLLSSLMLMSLSACTGNEQQSETSSVTASSSLESTEKTEKESSSVATDVTFTESATEPHGSERETSQTEPEVTDMHSETTAEIQTEAVKTEAVSEVISDTSFTEIDDTEEETTLAKVFEDFEVDSFKTTAEIVEQGGRASVTTDEGLKYSASGYSSLGDGFFVVNGALTVNFGADILEYEFNRITICYRSGSPMKCTFTYFENGEKKTDSFFLEAGEKVFSGLTENYINGYMATGLESAAFEPLSGENAEFMLYLARPNQRTVYDSTTHYLENERFKIGLRLVWGGGITYIEDKACEVPKLKNLINTHDAGRLVQQSYYGTSGNEEYQPGQYNGGDWVYNPVQGGDQYWNHSRLIDIKVGENYVYVKAQPQDWSLDNALTPSYMENTYTVYSDRIVVDNRFVDFSGWEHRFAHQELPAFYTVSYLGRFSYYNGLDPWSGGEIISHDNLTFDHTGGYFKLLSSNSETWCAWTNADDNYGIGLYVPEADMLLAARFEDGDSKNPGDNSCSYVAPVNTLQIKSFVPIEYSYMITTGSVGEIREVFYNHRDFADNAFLKSEYSQDIRLPDVLVSYTNIDFATAEHNKYLLPLNSATVQFNSYHNAAELIVKGEDPQINILYGNSDKPLKASNYGKIIIEYMIPASNVSKENIGELFLCTGDTLHAEAGKSVTLNYIGDGAYHTIEIDLSEYDFWSGRINSIRFDFLNSGSVGDCIFIKSIRLVE